MELSNSKNIAATEYTEEEKMKKDWLLEKMKNQFLTNEEYRYLQYLLMKYEFLYQSNYSILPPYPLCKIGITGDKIMFIADSHRGNKRIENKRLIDIAYNEALRQNIKAVVHAGDFIEACPVEHNKPFETVLSELQTAASDLPNGITTGLLLGNHDYSAIRTHPRIIPYYFNFPKLEILGMQKVLLNWGGQEIRINHPISQLKEPKIAESTGIITIEGHHHSYDFKEDLQTINLPSLSNGAKGKYNDFLYAEGFRAYSLFVIAERGLESLLFHNYCIDEHFLGTIKQAETLEVNTKTKQITLRR